VGKFQKTLHCSSEITVHIKQKRGIGVKDPPPGSFSGGHSWDCPGIRRRERRKKEEDWTGHVPMLYPLLWCNPRILGVPSSSFQEILYSKT